MRPGFSQWGLRSRTVCLAIVVFMVAGCAEERSLDDLMTFVETTHRDTAPKVEPLPEQIPVVSVTTRRIRVRILLRGAMSLGRRKLR